MLAFVFTNSL